MGCVESNTNAPPVVSQKKEEQETPATPEESRWFNRHKFKGLDFELCGDVKVSEDDVTLADGEKPEQHGGITFTDDIENDGKAKVKFDFELGEKAEGICIAILDSKAEGHREPGTWGKGLASTLLHFQPVQRTDLKKR